LWQARFYSCVMDAAHAHNGMAYVELNPVRAGLVRKPWRYRWSSAGAHCEGKEDALLAGLSAWCREYSADQWRETLRAVYRCGETSEVIREHTRTGRPLGSDSYIEALEQRLGRGLRAGRIGRPKRGWGES
jgi:putative transposase